MLSALPSQFGWAFLLLLMYYGALFIFLSCIYLQYLSDGRQFDHYSSAVRYLRVHCLSFKSARSA